MSTAADWVEVKAKPKVAGTEEFKSLADLRTARAVKRLKHDLEEVMSSAEPGISAYPVDDNMLEWHANVKGSEAPYQDSVFHFILRFTAGYPAEPPSLSLCTPLTHPNVQPGLTVQLANGKTRRFFRVCMNLLEQNVHEDPRSGWTSAYSVRTLLAQCQAFLLDKSHQMVGRETPENCAALAQAYVCHCGHSPSEGKLWPPMEERKPVAPIRVARPIFTASSSPANSDTSADSPRSDNEAADMAVDEEEVEESTSASPSAPAAALATPAPMPTPSPAPVAAQPAPQPKQEEGVWEVVQGKKRKNAHLKPSHSSAKQSPSSVKHAAFVKPAVQVVAVPKPKTVVKQAEQAQTAHAPTGYLAYLESATAKSHRRRAERRSRKRAALSANEEPSATAPAAPAQEEKVAESVPTPSATAASSSTAVVAAKPARRVVKKVAQKDVPQCVSAVAAAGSNNFGRVPYKVLLVHVMSFLSPKEVARMACVSREWQRISEEGYLWKAFFCRKYGARAQVTAQSMSEWKFAFMLELNNVLGDLRCFHSKASFEEEVLGIPLEYTINPRTKEIDYIYTTMDLISHSAFAVDKVRQTVYREKFQEFLPIYINEEHFQRALPVITKSIFRLCEYPGGPKQFQPNMVLDILPKVINTFVVLLCNKGVPSSERACEGLIAVHRLFYALVSHFGLFSEVDARIAHFLAADENRSKSVLPSLGDFVPLLLVSRRFRWLQVSGAFLQELLARGVIWAFKADQSLVIRSANCAEMKEHKDKLDWDRLKKTFEACIVSLRLTMFHAFFLERMTGDVGEVMRRYDSFYGRPPLVERKEFKDRVQKILAVKDWPEFFAAIRIKCPAPTALCNSLLRAIDTSLRKGYHRKDTKFEDIQAGGVSKILLKGETYAASTNLKRVVFHDSWRTGGLSSYLDGTALFFNTNGKEVGFVDYSHQALFSGAVTHSGDVMNRDEKTGQHTITFNLAALPEYVESVYFVLSAWTGNLSNSLEPFVKFFDPDTDAELCRYNLEPSKVGNLTSVVMCSLTARQTGKGVRQWSVKALGELGEGNAMNYAKIRATVNRLRQAAAGQ